MEARLDFGLVTFESPAPKSLPVGGVLLDADLVAAARQGDRSAFGILYERYSRTIHGVVLANVPFSEVDDIVQDVFLVAMRKLSSLREPGAFAGWLIAIARNRATDFYRRARNTEELPPEVGSLDADEGEARASLEAIRSLPETYRETLTLRLVEGMTGPEIAARTGLTPASVRVNLHRGMKQLREKLGRSQGHE